MGIFRAFRRAAAAGYTGLSGATRTHREVHGPKTMIANG